jgi:hypothetical protein
MPKAPVNKDDEPVPGKDQVRLPRQVAPMQPEAEAHRVQKPPDSQLWLGVGRSDARHQRTSFRIYYQCLFRKEHLLIGSLSTRPPDSLGGGVQYPA